MSISYRIDVEHNLVLTTASGTVTDDQVLEYKTRLVQDPDFKPGMRELADARNIDNLEITPAGVQVMVQQDRDYSAHLASHRLAIVLSEDVAFGMARMYQTMTESNVGSVGVFRDIEEARAWLHLN